MQSSAAQELEKPLLSGADSVRRRQTGLSQILILLLNDKASLVAITFLITVAVAALFAPVLIPESAVTLNFDLRLLPPSLTSGHLLGTDPLGRDVLARIVLATRVSMALAVVVVLVSVAAGTTLGMVAGYYGGRCDDIIMRFVDVVMGFPSLLLALIVLYALGSNVTNLVFVLAATRWVTYARVARAETLRLRHFQFVEAARLTGCADITIGARHILPNLMAVISTLAAMELGGVVLSESGLSFLGLGVQPPAASLGLLVAQGREYLQKAWWLMTFPGLMIFLLTMSVYILSNWLGIAMDPVQRWRLTSARRALSVKS